MDWLGVVFLFVWTMLVLLGLPGLTGFSILRIPSTNIFSGKSVQEWPSVSIIVAACNEEKTIEQGLASLLTLDYPKLEVIALNDRSTDHTAEIMHRLAGRFPQLRVMDITSLPEGWLGKNHALYRGAQAATGDWLLFTDADVVFHPLALKAAILHAVKNNLDHLCLAPKIKCNSVLLKGLVLLFMYNFLLFLIPQYARHRRFRAHMGVGAFNLIQTDVYRAVGTHRAIRMRPDDDMRLGKLVKQCGFQQDFAVGEDLLEVEWYHSVDQMIRGLEKNTMAPFEYRVLLLLFGLVPLTFFYLLPFIGPFVTTGWGRAVYAAMFFISFGYFLLLSRFRLATALYFFLFPITVPLLVYTLGRAAFLTWKRGGIVWRDTYYALELLRNPESNPSSR